MNEGLMSTTDHAAHKPIVVLTGGGTGGHITPILAVAHELKQASSQPTTIYIGEKGGAFKELTDTNQDIDQSYSIRAGKLRRYHGESWLTRLFDVKTNLLNLRDLFYVLAGAWQAWRLLGKIRPSVVFLKGGFVGVPVGIAAGLRKIPIVTHDSDVIPGLANRLVSRWVNVHATALPANMYAYPKHKVVQVGVLVEHSYKHVSPTDARAYREQLGLPAGAQIVLITGGSSGAQRLNEAVRQMMPKLLSTFEDLHVIHQVGKGKQAVYDGYKHDRLQVLEFLRPMYLYMGAADVVVARASGNTIAELGVQGKASIVVPSPFLTGGHQLENAKRLQQQGVALVVQEADMLSDTTGLLPSIAMLLRDETQRDKLAKALHKEAITDAAARLSKVLLEQVSS